MSLWREKEKFLKVVTDQRALLKRILFVALSFLFVDGRRSSPKRGGAYLSLSESETKAQTSKSGKAGRKQGDGSVTLVSNYPSQVVIN
jgi:hypothetical protein